MVSVQHEGNMRPRCDGGQYEPADESCAVGPTRAIIMIDIANDDQSGKHGQIACRCVQEAHEWKSAGGLVIRCPPQILDPSLPSIQSMNGVPSPVIGLVPAHRCSLRR